MVRRYWPENGYDSVMRECATMKESPHGAYVDYADYRELAKRCEKLEAALRALVDYDSEAHNDMSLLDNGPLWDQADAALSERSL